MPAWIHFLKMLLLLKMDAVQKPRDTKSADAK